MAFYLKPPEGNMPNHLFQLYAESRLKLLIALWKKRKTFTNRIQIKMNVIDELLAENIHAIPRLDALVQGTLKDRISHFALRTLSFPNPKLLDFINNLEGMLFNERLHNSKDAEKSLIMIIRQMELFLPFLRNVGSANGSLLLSLNRASEFLYDANIALKQILQSKVIFCAHTSSSKECPIHEDSVVLTVPFTQILNELSRLEIELHNGNASILCHHVPKYLNIVFKQLLETSTLIMIQSNFLGRIKDDKRILDGSTQLLKPLENEGLYISYDQSHGLISQPALSTEKVEKDELQYFPPCMGNLLRSLRKYHRLCHHPRVQLTLFLKHIGLSVENVLILIQEEYSKNTNSLYPGEVQHKCEHSWQKDSRRYIYGTRHLYGLEGARKNYSCHSCVSVQSLTRSGTCGGCPFVQNMESKLRILTEDLNGDRTKAEEFLFQTNNQNNSQSLSQIELLSPIESCHQYLCFKMKLINNSLEKVDKPLEDTTSNQGNEDSRVQFMTKPIHFYNVMKDFGKIQDHV